MALYAIKIAVTLVLIVAVTEVSRRSGLVAAALASLPIVSVVSFIWVYLDTRDASRVAALARDIAWLVPPSMVLFLVFPWLLQAGWGFWVSLATAAILTSVSYAVMMLVLRQIASG